MDIVSQGVYMGNVVEKVQKLFYLVLKLRFLNLSFFEVT